MKMIGLNFSVSQNRTNCPTFQKILNPSILFWNVKNAQDRVNWRQKITKTWKAYTIIIYILTLEWIRTNIHQEIFVWQNYKNYLILKFRGNWSNEWNRKNSCLQFESRVLFYTNSQKWKIIPNHSNPGVWYLCWKTSVRQNKNKGTIKQMSCIFCNKKDDIFCAVCNYNFCLAHHGIHNLITKNHAIKFQTRFSAWLWKLKHILILQCLI